MLRYWGHDGHDVATWVVKIYDSTSRLMQLRSSSERTASCDLSVHDTFSTDIFENTHARKLNDNPCYTLYSIITLQINRFLKMFWFYSASAN